MDVMTEGIGAETTGETTNGTVVEGAITEVRLIQAALYFMTDLSLTMFKGVVEILEIGRESAREIGDEVVVHGMAKKRHVKDIEKERGTGQS